MPRVFLPRQHDPKSNRIRGCKAFTGPKQDVRAFFAGFEAPPLVLAGLIAHHCPSHPSRSRSRFAVLVLLLLLLNRRTAELFDGHCRLGAHLYGHGADLPRHPPRHRVPRSGGERWRSNARVFFGAHSRSVCTRRLTPAGLPSFRAFLERLERHTQR